MDTKGNRQAYLAAFEVANSNLDVISREWELLLLQKGQLEVAVAALEPFLRSAKESSSEFHHPKPVRSEQPRATPELAIPASFSPAPEAILDPIQHRIN